MRTNPVTIRESGEIKEIKKCIVKVQGLFNCMVGQLILFKDNTKGFIVGFNEDEVLVLLLGTSYNMKSGDEVYSKAEFFKVPVGRNFVGRVINALCEDLDGKGQIQDDGLDDIFRDAPGVLDRIPVQDMLETGMRVIDVCIPIGKGQRELIIGDRMTGKTTMAVDIILNQKGKNVICIYCCIGRDYASFEKVVGVLKEYGALEYSIVVSALGASSIGEQYLAPYTAATLGEYFMYSGKDVVVVFDDLTKHAWAYREMSLLLERPPGREAYPGDIFYLHAQLMERAGKLSLERGGGSMSFFPIADTLQGDIAGFIPTNLISMTDGQIYLDNRLFGEGIRPSVNLGLSVSRIGNKVQPNIMRDMSKDLGLNYLQYRELLKMTRLRAGVFEEVSERLRRGEKIERIFIQGKNLPSPIPEQIILFYMLKEGMLDVLSDEECEYLKQNIFRFTEEHFPYVIEGLKGKELTTDIRNGLNKCVISFFKMKDVNC